MLAWLHAEQWRPQAGRVDRYSGWLGFGWGLLGLIVVNVVVTVTRGVLGGDVVPGV